MSKTQLGRRACAPATAKLIFDPAFTDGASTGCPWQSQQALVQAQGGTVRWTDDNLIGQALDASGGDAGRVRIYSPSHRLAATDTVTLFGLRGTTEGNVAASAITIVDGDYFELNGTTFANSMLNGAVESIARNSVGEVRVTSTGHGLSTNDVVLLFFGQFNIPPSTPFNRGGFYVQVIDANTFDLVGSVYPAGYQGSALWQIVGQWHAHGRLPSATVGQRLADGSSLLFTANLRRLAFIYESAAATVTITHYKQ
jgi:hypothetical protein